MGGAGFFDGPKPRYFAHRGDSARFPENTLPAFQSAIEAGLHYLEMDVHATLDGVIVVHHDESTLRTCGIDARIREISHRQLLTLDAGRGFRVPSLEEVLTLFASARLNIEIKQREPAIEASVLRLLKQHGAERRVLLAAEDDGLMKRIRAQAGEIPTSLSRRECEDFFEAVKNKRSWHAPRGARALQVPETFAGRKILSPEAIKKAQAAGLEVHVWTVNGSGDAKRLVEWGADGIFGDDATALAQLQKKA